MTKKEINKKKTIKVQPSKNNKDINHFHRSMRYLDNGRTISPASPQELHKPSYVPNFISPPTVLPLKIDIHTANNNPELKHNIEAEMINKEKDAKSIAAYNKRIESGTALDPDGYWRPNGEFVYFEKVPAPDQQYDQYQIIEEYPPSLTFAGKNRKTKRRKSLKKKTKRRKSLKKKQRKSKRRSRK